tara:strand:+ start:331 stop:612 length:282 start_codon:yes stop_codon:yes gene_type:complete
MKSLLQKTEPMSSAKEYERKISKVVNDTAAQQHIAEQAFTYEELRTEANLYAAGLITSLPNAKAKAMTAVKTLLAVMVFSGKSYSNLASFNAQ